MHHQYSLRLINASQSPAVMLALQRKSCLIKGSRRGGSPPARPALPRRAFGTGSFLGLESSLLPTDVRRCSHRGQQTARLAQPFSTNLGTRIVQSSVQDVHRSLSVYTPYAVSIYVTLCNFKNSIFNRKQFQHSDPVSFDEIMGTLLNFYVFW